MNNRLNLLLALKKSLEEKLLEEEQEENSNQDDRADGKDISSGIIGLSDEEGGQNAVQVHSNLEHNDLVIFANDLRKQLRDKIEFYKNDTERVPEWGSSINFLKNIEKKNYQDMRGVLNNALGADLKEEKLGHINAFRGVLYQSDSSIRAKTDKITSNLVISEKESNAKKGKDLFKEIQTEIESNLKFLRDELEKKNFLQRSQLLDLNKEYDLDEVLKDLSEDSVGNIIQKIIMELRGLHKSINRKIIEKENMLMKSELYLLIEQYKSGVRFVLDKYKDSIKSSNWIQFLDSLKRKSLRVVNYHKQQTSWSGQLKTLQSVVTGYEKDIESLIDANYAREYVYGSREKNPEKKARKEKIREFRLKQLGVIKKAVSFGKKDGKLFGISFIKSEIEENFGARSNLKKSEVQASLTKKMHQLQKVMNYLVHEHLKLKSLDRYWKTFLYALHRLIKDLGFEILSRLEKHHQIGYKKWNKALDLLDKLSSKSKSSIGERLSVMEKHLKQGKEFSWKKSLKAINTAFYNRHVYVNKLVDAVNIQNKATWKKELEKSSLRVYLLDEENDMSTPYKFLTALAEKEGWFNTEKPIFSSKKYLTQRFKKPAKDEEGKIIQDTYGDIVNWAEMYLLPYLVYGYRTSRADDSEDSTLEELHNIHRPSNTVVNMFFDQLITPEGLVSMKRRTEQEVINNTNFEAYFLTVLKNEANNFTRVVMTPNGVLINKDSEGSTAETGLDRRDRTVKEKMLFVSLDRKNTRLDDPHKENYSYIQKLEHFQNEFANLFDTLSGPFDLEMKNKYGENSLEYQWYKHYVADEAQQSSKDKIAVLQHNLRSVKPDLETLPEEYREVFLFKNPDYKSERKVKLGQIKSTIQELLSMGDSYLNVDKLLHKKIKETKLEELAGWVRSKQEGSLLPQEEGESEEDFQERVTSLEKKIIPPFLSSSLNTKLGLEFSNIPSYRSDLKRKLGSLIPDLDISTSKLKELLYKSWIDIFKEVRPHIKRSLTQEILRKRIKKDITSNSLVLPKEKLNFYVSVPFFQHFLERSKEFFKEGSEFDFSEKNITAVATKLAKFEIINPVIKLGFHLKQQLRDQHKSEFEIMTINLNNKYVFEDKVTEAREKVVNYLKKLMSEKGFNQTFLAIQEEFPEHFKNASVEKGIDSIIKEDFIENEDEDLIENFLTERDDSDQSITDERNYHYLSDMVIQDV